jgi:glycosyltransferase involved in cell wall biosynthesis
MPPLTAILIAKNEEKDLPRALASLESVADEIVLVDSGSTDRTLEIARQFGARIFMRPFQSFGEQKNYAATQAANDWLLSLDSDEVLSPELQQSLREWKQREPDRVGYQLSRISQYLGVWIRHSGWYPDYVVRLYRRDRGQFSGVPHDTVRLDEPPGRLAGHLHHFTINTIPEHKAKIEGFTTMASQDLFRRGKKHWLAQMLLLPPWTFFQSLVLRLGLLDGTRGWIIAWMAARYVFLKYYKLGLLRRGGSQQEKPWPQT